MPVAALYNVNRTDAKQQVFQPTDFMRPWRQPAQPARAAVPEPKGMRAAKPGERPPSRYRPGADDGVIQKFDAYAARLRS